MYSTLKKSLLIVMVIPCFCFGQEDDLLKELESLGESETSFELPAFKALQIGNLQSTKVIDKGDLYMVVAHRFGYLKSGIDEFYGLDQANTKIQLLYGLRENLQVGVSRDSYEKTYSGTAKYRIMNQSENKLVNIVFYGSLDINTLLNKRNYPGLRFGDRLSYTSQLLVSRRFSPKLSLQIAPILVRQNLVDLNYQKSPMHNFLNVGLGGRYKVSKRMSLNLDYVYNAFSFDITNNGISTNIGSLSNSLYKNPLTIGIDIETGGHVFQLLFTNS
ncbi:MAG: DUF5777 family beta-barrel protein, partial [Flavobacteriaceae bacterium]